MRFTLRRPLAALAILVTLSLLLVSCDRDSVPILQSPEPLSESSAPQSSAATYGTVTRVVDGDTIEVNVSGTLYRVRYIGIDTPEVGDWGAAEATQLNTQLVAGRTVRLEKDVSEIDRFGRLLRYVYVGDTFINAELVSLGYAQVSTYPPDVKYQQHFLSLQQDARQSGRGLWGVTQEATTEPATQAEGQFVGSINSDKYHYPMCQYAQRIYRQNRIWFSSVTEARANGYVPCKVCRPP